MNFVPMFGRVGAPVSAAGEDFWLPAVGKAQAQSIAAPVDFWLADSQGAAAPKPVFRDFWLEAFRSDVEKEVPAPPGCGP